MVVCPATEEADAFGLKDCFHRLGVFEDLGSIDLKGWCKSLAKGNGLRGNDVHVRSSLHSREDSFVDLLRNLLTFSYHNHAAAWTAEGLVGGHGHDIKTVIKRILSHSTSNKAGDVGNVRHCVRSNFARNINKLLVIKFATIGGKAREDNLWLMLKRGRSQRLIINFTRINILHLVPNKVEDFVNGGSRVSVRKVSAV